MASTLAQPPLRWDGETPPVLDQTRLPAHEAVLVLEGAEDTAHAIERLATCPARKWVVTPRRT
ncbi:MAG: hypothetical protein ACR2L8_16165 [Solirubrobacteraceae bacterium]